MNTILTRGCKRCGGNLRIEHEIEGDVIKCLQCSRISLYEPIPVLKLVNHSSFITKSNRNDVATNRAVAEQSRKYQEHAMIHIPERIS
jgi:hypothetical protein